MEQPTQVVLTTENGDGPSNTIVLEPDVWRALRAQLDEEREACARLCEEHKALRLSEIIRARGEK